MEQGTWFEGYKVSEREPSDESIKTMERWLGKVGDGYTSINCAIGTDYEGAIALWFDLPTGRGTSRGYSWEKRAMDTLRNLYIWREVV